MRELCTPAELVDEGIAMQHCAGSYRSLVRRRKVALFSMSFHDRRRLTIEVSLGAGKVVQAKRFANALPLPEEKVVLHEWAAHNRLRLGC